MAHLYVLYCYCRKLGQGFRFSFIRFSSFLHNQTAPGSILGVVWFIFTLKGGEDVPKKYLSDKQLAWIDYYKQGHSATEAARLAGYKATSAKSFQNIGSQNVEKLGEYIKERDKMISGPRIATMEEVNAFWTRTMNDENEDMQHRLKASELRAKAAGAFIQQVNIRGNVPVQIIDDIPEENDDG